MESKVLKAIATTSIFVLAMLGSPVARSTAVCTGGVSNVSFDAGGTLHANIGPLPWARLCSVHSVHNGVQTAACKQFAGQLMTAQLTGRTVTIFFTGRNTCTNPEWTDLPGFYFLQLN